MLWCLRFSHSELSPVDLATGGVMVSRVVHTWALYPSVNDTQSYKEFHAPPATVMQWEWSAKKCSVAATTVTTFSKRFSSYRLWYRYCVWSYIFTTLCVCCEHFNWLDSSWPQLLDLIIVSHPYRVSTLRQMNYTALLLWTWQEKKNPTVTYVLLLTMAPLFLWDL